MAGEMCTFKWQGKRVHLNGKVRLNGDKIVRLNGKAKVYV